MKQNNKKGVIFTLDAILAIISAMILISGTLFYLSQTHTISWTEGDLSQLGMDSLMTLELAGNLNATLLNQTGGTPTPPIIGNYTYSDLEEFQNIMLESHVCAEWRFYDADVNATTGDINMTLLGYYINANCTNTKNNFTKSAISRRVFMMNEMDIRLAEMEVWYVAR